jgi:hypothetical protein
MAKRAGMLIAALLGILLFVACIDLRARVHRVGSHNTGTTYGVYVQGNYAYIANNDGLVVIDPEGNKVELWQPPAGQ